MGHDEFEIQILTDRFRIEGSIRVAAGASWAEFVKTHHDQFTLYSATLFNLDTGDPVQQVPQITVNREAILAYWPENAVAKDRTEGEFNIKIDQLHSAKIKDMMVTTILTVGPHVTVNDAFQLMTANRVRHLIIMDGKDMLGLVSDRDLRIHLLTKEKVTVADVMSAEVVTVEPDSLIIDALRIMLKRKLSCLPVMEKGGLSGLITETDFLRCLELLLSTK